VTPEFAAKEQFTESLAALPVTEQAALGFSAADFILECTYDGVACDMRTYVSTYLPFHLPSVYNNIYHQQAILLGLRREVVAAVMLEVPRSLFSFVHLRDQCGN